MAIDPYVPVSLDDLPRAGEKLPAHSGWRSVRPGDSPELQPKGECFGSPGPDAGYALSLAEAFKSRLQLRRGESIDQAMAAGISIAVRRASTLGRAPIKEDLNVAFTSLGLLGEARGGLPRS